MLFPEKTGQQNGKPTVLPTATSNPAGPGFHFNRVGYIAGPCGPSTGRNNSKTKQPLIEFVARRELHWGSAESFESYEGVPVSPSSKLCTAVMDLVSTGRCEKLHGPDAVRVCVIYRTARFTRGRLVDSIRINCTTSQQLQSKLLLQRISHAASISLAR